MSGEKVTELALGSVNIWRASDTSNISVRTTSREAA